MNEKFTVVKKGYDKTEVEEYIANLEAVVKSYKDKDIAIKNAILNAQIAADDIIKNAEIEATSHKLKSIEKLDDIKKSISNQKLLLKDFQLDYNRLINKYLKDYNNIEFKDVNLKLDELEKYIEDVIVSQPKSIKNLTDETKVIKTIKPSQLNDTIINGEKIKIAPTDNGIKMQRE